MKRIALILPVHNKLEYTKTCLDSLSTQIFSQKFNNYKANIIVIDDGSNDGTGDWILKNYPDTIVLFGDGNLWWSGGVNIGAKYALDEDNYDYLLLWNNDITTENSYFQELDKLIEGLGDSMIIGSKIFIKNKPEIIWSYGGIFDPRTGKKYMIGLDEVDSEKYSKPISVDWLTGMGTVVPVNVIKKIGLWDERNFPQYHGDSDFTYRAKLAGIEVVVNPKLKIWNDNTNTGLKHNNKFKDLILTLSDIRSNLNIKKNLLFYKKYSKSFFAYWPLFIIYLRLFGGFFKWKVLSLFGKQRLD